MCDKATCDQQTKQRCIETFSASQLSTIAVLILFLFQYVKTEYTDTPKLSWFVNISVIFSIVYFIVGSWIIEERYIWELRKLRTPCRQLEFFIRFVAMIVLYIGISSSSFIQTTNGFPISVAFTLMGLGILYFLWDLVVYFGGGGVPVMVHADFLVVAASFFWGFFGVGLAGGADVGGFLLGLSTLAFLVPLVVLYLKEKEVILDFLHRFARDRVR